MGSAHHRRARAYAAAPLAAIFSVLAFAAPVARAVTLQQLIDNATPVLSGELIYSNFSSGGVVPASSIDVTFSPGITFGSTWNSGSNNSSVINYTVTINPSISAMYFGTDLGMTGNASSNGASVIVGQVTTDLGTSSTYNSQLYFDGSGGLADNVTDGVTFPNPVTSIRMVKSIELSGPAGSASSVDQVSDNFILFAHMSSSVQPGASYANIKLLDTVGHLTLAQLLGGTATAAGGKPTLAFGPSVKTHLVSDLVALTGTTSDPVVFSMTYDPAALGSVDPKLLMLLWDGGSPFSQGNNGMNAVDGNDYKGIVDPLAGKHLVVGPYDPAIDFHLGWYGVDTVDGSVWAVINHNSTFGVGVPEPTSLTLLGAGSLMMLRRKRDWRGG